MTNSDLREIVGGEPTWEIVQLFPAQGGWTEGDYLALSTNRLVELSEGRLEFPPMPTEFHQLVVAFLYETVKAFVALRGLGTVLFAPLRIRLWEGKFREPDLAFMLAEHADRRGERHWNGADLVMEVVSADDPNRDWVEKRDEYARAGISEYWIVDPRDATITVHCLSQDAAAYQVAGRYARGEQAASLLLPGLTVDVEQAFSQAR